MTASTPEQDEARRTAEQEAGGSRQVRRRLTFGVAGDLADMPATLSPWQRAYEAWRAAGLKWGHGAPPRREQTPEAAETASTGKKAGAAKKAAPKKPAGKKPAGKKDAGKKSDGKKGAGKKAALDPADVLVAGPGLAAARKGAAPRRLRSRLAVATGLMVVAGGAIFTVTQGESGSDEPGVPAPVAADALFAPDPAAETDGLVQELTAVTSAGGTLVAVGTEGDGAPGRERSRFLYSVDAGRTWSLARLRSAGGPVAPAGDSPDMVTAGDRGWVALGRSSGGGTVAWTSENAQTWTRHDLGAVFKPSDDVRGVARTATGSSPWAARTTTPSPGSPGRQQVAADRGHRGDWRLRRRGVVRERPREPRHLPPEGHREAGAAEDHAHRPEPRRVAVHGRRADVGPGEHPAEPRLLRADEGPRLRARRVRDRPGGQAHVRPEEQAQDD